MNIKWIGSPNYNSRQNHKIIAIVFHIMEGTLAGTDSWLQDRANRVSYHYGIGLRGEIHQYVKEEHAAWHAGIVENQTWNLYTGINPNYLTVGIACEGRSGDPFTEPMTESLIALTRRVMEDNMIEFDPDKLIGHYQISGTRRANCPGPSFPWDILYSALQDKYIDVPEWKKEGLLWLRDNGLVTADYWGPEDTVDMGTLGAILEKVAITGRR